MWVGEGLRHSRVKLALALKPCAHVHTASPSIQSHKSIQFAVSPVKPIQYAVPSLVTAAHILYAPLWLQSLAKLTFPLFWPCLCPWLHRLSRPYSASPYPLPDVGRRPVSAPYDPSYPSGPPQGARLPHMYDYSMSPDVSGGGGPPGDLGGPGFGGYPDPLRSEIGEWQALSPEQYGGGMGYERGVGVQYGPDGMMAPMADAAMQSDGGEG